MPENTDNTSSSFWESITKAFRTLLLVIVIRNLVLTFTGPKGSTDNTFSQQKDNLILSPKWTPGSAISVDVYLSGNADFSLQDAKGDLPIASFRNLTFGSWSEDQSKEVTILYKVSDSVRVRNESLYAHAFLFNENPVLDSNDKVLQSRVPLLEFSKRRKAKSTRNLLMASDMSTPEPVFVEEGPVIGHWIGNISIYLVPDEIKAAPSSIPPIVRRHLLYDEDFRHFPIFNLNLFWNLRKEYIPIDESVTEIPLTIKFSPLAFWKFQFMLQFEESLKSQSSMGNDPEEFKEMLRDANPYLLAVTFVVSLLHSVFDFLAFKNDIQFWKDRDDFDGLSVRSILLNIGFQFVVLLYLFDNETSYLVLISSFIGLLIEVWKARKAMDFKLDKKFPFIRIEDKSSKKSKTKEYDEQAIKYLSYAAYPLLFGYAIYSLYYNEHKSWYSYILGTLVGFIYAFGFIMMTPQLFINYKLKSVAHMPWKTFMYKALNTFIDDLFAFAIKMPTLHRIACLRDDVIFLVYLYQRWIYPVDKARANEFGQKEVEPEKDKEKKE